MNLPTPHHQVRPPIQTALGQLSPVTQGMRVTSPINTSSAASNAAFVSGDPTISNPTGAPIMPAQIPLPPVATLAPSDGTIMGLTPLGWGVVLVSAFAAYKIFFGHHEPEHHE